MIKNYLKTAWRNLAKNKAHSFINITGLSVGMCVAMLIAFWIYDELSYNRNFKNYDRIARVVQNVTNNGEVQTWQAMPWPLAQEIRTNYGADFKYVAMSTNGGGNRFQYGDKKLSFEGVFFEESAPEMLDLKMIHGKRDALKDPSSILISESMAKAFFGDGEAINQVLLSEDSSEVKVAGVYQDIPLNSSFGELKYIASWKLFENQPDGIKTMEDPWRPNAFQLYVQLNDGVDINQASLHIRDAKLKKVNPQLQKKKPALFLHPMKDWYLRDEFKSGFNIGGRIQYVWMFGIIGIFVLLLACINFMNLSTARSEKRAKEVGIRKAIGSLRSQLVNQFFSESILVSLFAFLFSVLLAALILPFFNEIANKHISVLWSSPFFWIGGILFSIATGVVAGIYPALYLSSFKPVKVLKGIFKAGPSASIPRKVLLVVQFTVSVVLIIGTIVVYDQIQYAKNRPLGYSRDRLVSVPLPAEELRKHFETIRTELIKKNVVDLIASADAPPTQGSGSTSGISWPGKDPNLSIDFQNIGVSHDYGKTVGWEIKDGRDFSRDFPSDTSGIILNEAAAKFMGLKNPVGTPITWWKQNLHVVGVVKNLVINSPYETSRPNVYYLNDNTGYFMLARLKTNIPTTKAIDEIKSTLKTINADSPFEYSFVDDEFAKKFGDEERVGKLAGFFSLLAILICCLGLFGLASFVAEQRTKEIGVRKVLGASVINCWNLLSRDFVKLLMISFLISVPLAWYFMHNWLQNYDYRTSLSWWIFAAAGIGALFITVVVVSFQAIKAALANPVKSLRTE